MIEFLIKSTIAMGVLLGLYYILFEREKMHRFNRFYLISALVFSLALPFISIPVYVEAEVPVVTVMPEQFIEFKSNNDMPVEAVTETMAAAPVEPIAAPKPEINYLPYIGWGVYLLVVLALAIKFAINVAHFYRLRRKNENIAYNGATLILLDTKVLPHTFIGNIYLNRNDYENRLIEPELFTHEMVHVKQYHTLDILFIEALKTIFWFNPLLYFYKKAIQFNHEFLADEKVIDSTANTVYYQNLLLEKATVGKTFFLASNLNFSLTKKRFIMMTKTTNKTKSLLLKFAILPASAGLLYFLSTETVVLANTTTAIPPAFMTPEAVVTAVPETIIQTITDTVRQQAAASTRTTDPEARKNEYFKGVRIIITDAPKGKYIDLPYEQLTAEQKHYYLPEAPEKKGKATGIQDADYNYSLYTLYNEQGGQFFIDDKKVTRDEILAYKKEDFATYAAKSSGMKFVDGKAKGNHKSFFYTYPYYNKYLKSINDHYPDKTLRITITGQPEEYKSEYAEEAKATGKTELQISQEREKKDLETTYYPTVEERKEKQRNLYPRFPGGSKEFDQYLADNLKLADRFKDKSLSINFTVNTNGKLTDVWIPGEKDEELLTEVKRVIENSPKWIPNQQNGEPSKVGISVNFPPKPTTK
jgi:beta-lactamase regulating signal transducer with metallopeptidase domain